LLYFRGFKQTDVKNKIIGKIWAAFDIIEKMTSVFTSIGQNRVFDKHVTDDDVIKCNIEFFIWMKTWSNADKIKKFDKDILRTDFLTKFWNCKRTLWTPCLLEEGLQLTKSSLHGFGLIVWWNCCSRPRLSLQDIRCFLQG